VLTVAPTIHVDNMDVAATVFASSETDVVVIVDSDDRPLGLLTAESGLRRQPLVSHIAKVCSTPAELAHRLSTGRAYDAALPTVVTGSGGRYVGVVTIQRLMAHLADASLPAAGGP
jgi:hypothetical protein